MSYQCLSLYLHLKCSNCRSGSLVVIDLRIVRCIQQQLRRTYSCMPNKVLEAPYQLSLQLINLDCTLSTKVACVKSLRSRKTYAGELVYCVLRHSWSQRRAVDSGNARSFSSIHGSHASKGVRV